MSSVIKTDGSRGPAFGVHATPFNLQDVEEKASRYLQQVRGQAAQIIARAKEEAGSIQARAQKDGRQQALKDAQRQVNQQVQQQVSSLLPALRQAVAEIDQVRGQCLRHWQNRVMHLAVAIAERILRCQLPKAPELTETLIQESLDLAAGNTNLRLHLNPQDYETMHDRVPELARTIASLASSDIVVDPSVSPGGCIVKTEFGQIDQTIEAQLKRIEEELSDEG